MENTLTLEQIQTVVAATVRKTLQEELRKFQLQKRKPLSDDWLTEKEVIAFCGKSRHTLRRAIQSGKFNLKDIRANPIGKGYLFRRTAIIKE